MGMCVCVCAFRARTRWHDVITKGVEFSTHMTYRGLSSICYSSTTRVPARPYGRVQYTCTRAPGTIRTLPYRTQYTCTGTKYIPTGLLMEEVVLDLTFAPDGSYGKNERCVFMPGLSSKTKDSLISVSVIDLGQGGTEEKDVILYDTVDLNADRSVKSNPKYGGRLLVDINANGETENVPICQ